MIAEVPKDAPAMPANAGAAAVWAAWEAWAASKPTSFHRDNEGRGAKYAAAFLFSGESIKYRPSRWR